MDVSQHQALRRHSSAAETLLDASGYGTVRRRVPGTENRMIAGELRKLGWLGEKHASSRHWSSAIYHRPFI